MPPKCSGQVSPLTSTKFFLYTSILYTSPTAMPDQLGPALVHCSLLTYIYMCIYTYIIYNIYEPNE